MDISAAAGSDLNLDSVVTNPDGSVRNLAGATGEFPVYDSPSATVEVASGTAEITDPENGKVSFTLDADQTTAFTDTVHVLYYETWLDETGEVTRRTRLDNGRLTLT